MSLHIISGGPGSGKTEYIIRKFLKESGDLNKKFFLLVPEQDTLSMQKRMVFHKENKGKGMLNTDVLNFSRLAYRVFEETDQESLNIIDDTGKILILRGIAEEKAGELSVYKKQVRNPGFLCDLKSQISEFIQYRIRPESLLEASDKSLNQLQKGRLKDLHILYKAFTEELQRRKIMTEEELLERLLRVIPDSKLLKGSYIAFTGFTGFSPLENEVIKEIMRLSEEIYVSLTYGSGIYSEKLGDSEEPIFSLSDRAYRNLYREASGLGLEIKYTDLNRDGEFYRFKNSPELELLERRLFRERNFDCGSLNTPILGKTLSERKDDIELWQAKNPMEEAEFISQRIEEYVREGKRYRDIAVLLLDIDEYKDILTRKFKRKGIPYYFDDPKTLFESNVSLPAILSLKAIEENFSQESVISFLRSFPFNINDLSRIDYLENYIRKRGLRGYRAFSQEFSEFEEERTAFIGPLLRLKEKLSEKKGLSEKTEVLKEMLSEMHFEESLEELIAKIKNEEPEKAEELSSGEKALDQVFERIRDLTGNTKADTREFSDILKASFKEQKIRTLPLYEDRVQIGDIKRSRFQEPDVFFVAGLNEDMSFGGASLINDRDRRFLSEMGILTAPGSLENVFIERFYLYRAFLTPREKLILTMPAGKMNGGAQYPPYFLESFKGLTEMRRTDSLKADLFTKRDMMSFVAEKLSQKDTFGPEFKACLRILNEDGDSGQIKKLLENTFIKDLKLKEETAGRLFGETITGTVSRIECFFSCPYRHFLSFGLGLKEREERSVTALDLGNIYHQALQYAFSDIKRAGEDIGKMDTEELTALSEDSLFKVASDYSDGLFFSSGRNSFICSKAERVLRRTLLTIRDQMKSGQMNVKDTEKEFEIRKDGLFIRGRIDRIDYYEDGDSEYVRITDYKSGSRSFKLSEVFDGTLLQLPVYLKAVMNDEKIIPAAILYYNIDDPGLPYISGESPENMEERRLSLLRGSGIINKDKRISEILGLKEKDLEKGKSSELITALSDFALGKMEEASREIERGNIEILPLERESGDLVCDFCEYRRVCRYEGPSVREREKRPDTELWEEIENGVDRGTEENNKS